MSEELSKEQRILVAMRKVLTNIIKDTTPPPGMRHPLHDSTIEDVRQCLGLIAARERELADEAGDTVSRKPYYVDEIPPQGKVVSLKDLSETKKKK